ncbi:hypothetical protein [Streptomyces flaveolus]
MRDDPASLWLLASSPDEDRVELTELGRQVAGESVAEAGRLDRQQ